MMKKAGILLLPLLALLASPAILPAEEPAAACPLFSAEATTLPAFGFAPESPPAPFPLTENPVCGQCGVSTCRGLNQGSRCTTSAGTWGHCVALTQQCADDAMLCACS